MKNQSNVTLASVAEAFSQLSTSGTEQILTGGSTYTEGESHIQGIAQYGNYYLITQNRYEHDEGKLYFFDATNGQYVNAIHLPVNSGTQNDDDHQYNHPGGIQVIDNYLLVPVQTQDYAQSKIQLWDLSPLDAGSTDITLVNGDLIPASDNLKIGGIGITAVDDTYVAAACNNTIVYIYQSTGSDLTNITFNAPFTYTLPDSADEVCLITEDATNNIYLIAFSTAGTLQMVDYATLYQVDLTNQTLTQVANTHFITQYINPISPFGVHFRYGAGMNITANGGLNLFATQRVMQGKCAINIFS